MKGRKILLAEDDQMLASLLQFWLEKEGYEVNVLENGLEVKESLKQALPDIIISDIMMPYFSGIELVDHVRNEVNSKLPIILISSASNDENILNAFELGATDFLSKPISPSELLVRVSRALNTVSKT
ncbi:response regulator transcription factor [Flagellimonas lutaonensis]|uniref:response regulator transcription factor n=1 Tax=Flagellimonas lutaonensis TaxID=516051 RepID=UPI000B1F847D|nr:response regulator transcription factor [Allomuricauda lutaonensis]